MRKILVIEMVLAITAGILLAGCTSDSQNLEDENATLARENTELQTELDASNSNLEAAGQRIAGLEEDINDILQGDESKLRDPTWAELERFVETDKTDTREYILSEFDCEGFTITLRDHAWRRGFRSGYVAIGLGENAAGHALNAFQTTDKGLVYVDNSEQDTIGYIKIGEVYGTIALDGVRKTYINCDIAPDQFWKPITYSSYSGNLFDYGYYENYARRDKFYGQSISAYNEDVKDYNSAVTAFNHGGGTYSKSELEARGNKLDTWAQNLDLLLEDLGSIRIEPLGAVESLEIYWN